MGPPPQTPMTRFLARAAAAALITLAAVLTFMIVLGW
jgi:hypothetical protein